MNNKSRKLKKQIIYLYFTKKNFEELKKCPISLVRIQFSGASKDYVIKREFVSESLKTKTIM
jgi:hypothetical protein